MRAAWVCVLCGQEVQRRGSPLVVVSVAPPSVPAAAALPAATRPSLPAVAALALPAAALLPVAAAAALLPVPAATAAALLPVVTAAALLPVRDEAANQSPAAAGLGLALSFTRLKR